ncbi:MAG: SDR family oxidoreductase [Bacillus sp. (in: firmicutes)]
MNLFIFGANGQVGRHLVEELVENGGHQVKIALRKKEQFSHFQDKDVTSVLLDLEDTVDTIAKELKGMDVVIFTAGSGGSTGADKTLLIDLDGAVKTIEAAEQSGVKQYIMVSALGADKRSTWNEEIKPYYVAKYYADQALLNSRLNYTIVRPGLLTNDAKTGTVSSETSDDYAVSRRDVAAALAEVIGRENAYKKEFNLLPGNTDIRTFAEQL